MKNVNYDLLKMLHNTCDDCWRLKKYYIKDAQKAKCKSAPILKKILKDREKQLDLLREAIITRAKAGKFD